MDRTDFEILKILQQNARTKNTELGKLVSLTPPAVTERLYKLENSGVIEGYRAIINPEKIGKNITAFIHIQITPEKFNPFLEFAESNPYIHECYHTIGRNCILIKVLLHTTSELEELLKVIKRFGLTETSIVLSTKFKFKPIEPQTIK